jgi:hypothetical protein
MSSFSERYGVNFNATNPLPPLMSSTTATISMVHVCICLFGLVSSVLLMTSISRSTTSQNRAIRRVQAMLCLSDASLYITYIVFLSTNTYFGQVPNNLFCQVNGVAIHFVCTSNFTTITYAVYDRYYRLVRMKVDRGKAAGKVVVPPHERIFKYLLLPFLLLHALLPAITAGGYGIYIPKPNNSKCYAGGGKGVLAHDVFPVANLAWFLGCFCVIVVASWRSLAIIKELLSENNVQSNAGSAKRVEAERRAMWHSIATTLLFLTGE